MEISEDNNDTRQTVDKEYLVEQEYWNDLPTSNVNISKQKQVAQRQPKLKDFRIIEREKAIVRSPSFYKFDRSTTHLLQTLIDQRQIGEFHNILGKGTNSVVIHAHCEGRYRAYFPDGNAVKVYKLSNSVEKNNAIFKKVQREYETLLLLQKHNFCFNAPHPVLKNKNVLIMSSIGPNQECPLSISTLPAEKMCDMYHKIVKEMDTWYNKLSLIHGSLSTRKIIDLEKLYFIGWSHSVRADHPMALKKLMKDCIFVSKFFRSRGVTVTSAEELFQSITGIEKISQKVLQIAHKDLWKGPNLCNPNRTTARDSRTTQNRFKC